MINLDALEQAYAEMHDSGAWEDYNPALILPLIRVVRAANAKANAKTGDEWFAASADLNTALVPFQPG